MELLGDVFVPRSLGGVGWGTVRAEGLFGNWLAEMWLLGFGLYVIPLVAVMSRLLRGREELMSGAVFLPICGSYHPCDFGWRAVLPVSMDNGWLRGARTQFQERECCPC